MEGLKMHITNVEFTVPEGNNSWWPTFAGITKNSTVRFYIRLSDHRTNLVSSRTRRKCFHSKSHLQSMTVEWARLA